VEARLFQSIGRGWTFLKQSWTLGQKTPAVLFPTLAGLVVSVIILLIMMLPLGGMIIYLRKEPWGQVAIGTMLGLLLVILVAIASTMAVLSSNLAGTALSDQKPTTAGAWEKVSELGGDLYWMGLGLPVYRSWLTFRRLFLTSKSSGWEDAEHLLVPVLANEQVSMREAPGRIVQMQVDNCVFTADSVGIRRISVLLTLSALLIGLAVGLGLAWLVLTNGQDPSRSRALAFGLTVLITAIFTLPVAHFCSYAITLFNTCLYRWGVTVRDARKTETSAEAAVPEPLAVALGIRSGR
jgi:hypothetical protein